MKPSALRMSADPRSIPTSSSRPSPALADGDASALAKAAAEGLPERADVAEWIERCKRLVLLQRERSALRSELPQLAQRALRAAQGACPPAPGAAAIVEAFLPRLPAIRALLDEDVEAAFRGDPAARGFGEIVAAYPAIRAIAIHRIAHELYQLRRADAAAHDVRARAPAHRHRHPPRRAHRPALLHRPRHRRRDRRDHRDRRRRADLPGRHAGRAHAAPRRVAARRASAIPRSRTTSRSTPAPPSWAATR